MKYEFELRLREKLEERDGDDHNLIEVPHQKGVKTTRKCSACNSEHVRIKQDRTVVCLDCGFKQDRDQNAARNAYNYR
jgi:transposase